MLNKIEKANKNKMQKFYKEEEALQDNKHIFQ